MGDDTTLVEDCFGVLKQREGSSSELVRRFTLANGQMSMQVITYGATITSVKVPDREGNVDDVVLGYDELKGYLDGSYYFGCTIGRVANRIANGSFYIQGQEYKLSTNDGLHHLHGGLVGFDKVLWDSHVEGKAVTFSYTSPSREENYPGELMCEVTYKLTEDNKIVIHYKALSTHPTPVNLTNHSYFNLAGHASGSIRDHVISIEANAYTPVDKSRIPTGEIVPVENTVYDIRQPKMLGSFLQKLPNENLDINFCVRGRDGEQRSVGRLYDPKSGRLLTVSSSQPGVQVYTANFLPTDDSLRGKGGKFYHRHGATCLETQNYPDAVNHKNFPQSVIGPGEIYKHTTVFAFSTE